MARVCQKYCPRRNLKASSLGSSPEPVYGASLGDARFEGGLPSCIEGKEPKNGLPTLANHVDPARPWNAYFRVQVQRSRGHWLEQARLPPPTLTSHFPPSRLHARVAPSVGVCISSGIQPALRSDAPFLHLQNTGRSHLHRRREADDARYTQKKSRQPAHELNGHPELLGSRNL